MPKLDQCHDQVVRAFQKAGWHLDDDPARISTSYRTTYVDLQVSRGLNGNRQQILLVEVKLVIVELETETIERWIE